MDSKQGLILVLLSILLISSLWLFTSSLTGFLATSTEKSPIVVDQTLIKILVKTNEVTTKPIRIMNAGKTDSTIELKLSESLSDIVNLSESSFDLKAGQNKIVQLSFRTKLDSIEYSPGVYVGKLLIEFDSTTETIPVIVEIESFNVLFDTNLNIQSGYRRILPGNYTLVEVKLFNLMSREPTSVMMDYSIKDLNGNTIITEAETVVVTTQTTFTKSFHISETMTPGTYVFTTSSKYGSSVGTSSYVFEVVTSLEQDADIVALCLGNSLCLMSLFALIVIIATLTISLHFIAKMKVSAVRPEVVRKQGIAVKKRPVIIEKPKIIKKKPGFFETWKRRRGKRKRERKKRIELKKRKKNARKRAKELERKRERGVKLRKKREKEFRKKKPGFFAMRKKRMKRRITKSKRKRKLEKMKKMRKKRRRELERQRRVRIARMKRKKSLQKIGLLRKPEEKKRERERLKKIKLEKREKKRRKLEKKGLGERRRKSAELERKIKEERQRREKEKKKKELEKKKKVDEIRRGKEEEMKKKLKILETKRKEKKMKKSKKRKELLEEKKKREKERMDIELERKEKLRKEFERKRERMLGEERKKLKILKKELEEKRREKTKKKGRARLKRKFLRTFGGKTKITKEEVRTAIKLENEIKDIEKEKEEIEGNIKRIFKRKI